MSLTVEVYKVKTKLTSGILAQVQEATMVDMSYALEKGTILGYINPIGPGLRVFLLVAENGDYRKITNYQWSISPADPLLLFSSVIRKGVKYDVKKPFSTETAKINFLEMFKEVKKIALLTHIYV